LIPGCSKPNSAKPNGKDFTKAPPMTIDKSKTYIVTFKTTCGPMTWKLDAKNAPATTNNIVFLVKQHYFDNTTIPRVNATSTYAIIQGGTQNGTISGGVGYTYPGETPKPTAKYTRGTLAMANSGGPSTNGSQWFVVVKTWSDLPPNYTIFGTVTGAASFTTLDRMIKAQGEDLGQGLGVTPNPPIKIISATLAVQ
jgi:cyclophilin family peptidyl-prolyl cis-trans isomerase